MKLPRDAKDILKTIRKGNLFAVLVLADWLEEHREEEKANALRLEYQRVMKGVGTWKRAALQGDKGRKYPVAEMVARWYGSLLRNTFRELKPGMKRIGVEESRKIMLPAAWETVKEWRQQETLRAIS